MYVADWENTRAKEKLDLLWSRVEGSRYPRALPTDWASQAKIEEYFTSDHAAGITIGTSDWHARPRKKPIHTFGVVARGLWVAAGPDRDFTGAFALGAEIPVLVRYSLGVAPDSVGPGEGAWHLGVAVKLLFDDRPSANLLFLHNFEGVDDPDLLGRPGYTAVRPPPPELLLQTAAARRLQAALDGTNEPARQALWSGATRASAFTPGGTEIGWPKAPTVLRIEHSEWARRAFAERFLRGRTEFRRALGALLPNGEDAFACVGFSDDAGAPVALAEIRLQSRFVASRFADTQLRFGHELLVAEKAPEVNLPDPIPPIDSPLREFRLGPGPRLPRRRPTMSNPVDLSRDFRGIDDPARDRHATEMHGWNKVFRAAIGRIPLPAPPRGDGVLEQVRADLQPGHSSLIREFEERVRQGPKGGTWLPVLLRFLDRGSPEAKRTWQISEAYIRQAPRSRHRSAAQVYKEVVGHWARQGHLALLPHGEKDAPTSLLSTSWTSLDGPHSGGPSLGDWDLPSRILNGVAPALLAGSLDSDKLLLELSFLDLPQDGPYGGNLPEIHIVLAPVEAFPGLAVERIDARFENAKFNGSVAPDHDSSHWAHAQRLARMALLISGETDWHIARAHVLTEHYFTCLVTVFDEPEGGTNGPVFPPDAHPMDCLLRPHLRSSDRINNFGDPLIFGPAGILANATALTPEGVTRRIHQQLGQVDWLGFEPRQPVNEHHTFAKAGRIYWEVCRKAVHDWFSDYPVDAEGWKAVERFFEILVRSSVPYQPVAPPAGHAWRDLSEMARDIPGRPRGTNEEGEPAAMHPLSPSPAARQEDLEQLCAHAIFHATFLHSWTGAAQFRDGYDPIRTPLGLRSAEIPKDDTAWIATGPCVEDAGMQMAMAELLSRVEWGYILKDEPDRDTVPHLRRALLERWMDLEKAGVKPYGIRARINN